MKLKLQLRLVVIFKLSSKSYYRIYLRISVLYQIYKYCLQIKIVIPTHPNVEVNYFSICITAVDAFLEIKINTCARTGEKYLNHDC